MVRVRNGSTECQSQACAASPPRAHAVGPDEPPKHLLAEVLRNPGALVGDLEQPGTIPAPCTYGDVGQSRAVANGVFNQVVEGAPQQIRVGLDCAYVRYLRDDFYLPGFGGPAPARRQLLNQVGDIDL